MRKKSTPAISCLLQWLKKKIRQVRACFNEESGWDLRNKIHLIVLSFVACSLLISAFGDCKSTAGALTVRGLSVFGLMGVAWLWRYCWSLVKPISSMVESVKDGKAHVMNYRGDTLVKALNGAIIECVNNYRSQVKKLEIEVKDLQIQVHISKRQSHDTEAIIYSIRDAVIVTDSFDRLLMANKPAQLLFGFETDQVQLKSVEEFIQNDTLLKLLRQSKQGKIPHVKREVVIETDGEPRTYDCIISCIQDESENPTGTVAVLHDITREKQISQMKTDFVSHVSHELKTPLSSITAYAEMLAEGEITDEDTRIECYSTIHSQAQRLNLLIEDILNISRIESGLVKINKESISLALLVKDAVKVIETRAAEKKIKVNEKCSIVCDQVNADKEMMSRVIINLLSNAVKYTPDKGSVTIESEVDDADNVVRVFVSDTGVGIPAKEVEHVFDKFYRVSSNKKFAKGTGLGLNLVKQIVEKVHDGRVFVESEQGKGSRFGFELPLQTGQPAVVS